jgi:localization factor PodJL
MRDRLRQDATRPSETGVRFIDKDIDRDDERGGVRTSIALFVIILLILSAGLIGYSGWRMWSSGQLEISLPSIPWLNPAPIEQPVREPAAPEPIAPEPVETTEPLSRSEQDNRADTQSVDAETETIPTEDVTPEPPVETAALTPVPTQPAPQANAAGPTPAQLYAEALDLLEDGADVEAARLLEEAADMGLTIAQFRLATLYETGHGVSQDYQAARDWYAQAAEGGNARAMHNLAVLYAEGTVSGTPDYAEAARWFAEAASYDIRDSQYNLAVLFERGLGVRTDLRQAYLWYSIASVGGDTEAASRSTNLTDRLADSVRTRIDAAVMNWEPRPLDPIANGQLSVSHPLGATPREITQAQQLLIAIGSSPGPADGVMGGQTANAIRDFQRSAGMTVTGRVTPELISRLERAVAARSSGG